MIIRPVSSCISDLFLSFAEKLAAELVKRTKEVEKKNSQLKKHCEDMEEQRKKSVEYTEYLEYWNSLLKHSLKMMGFSAADFMKEVAELGESNLQN
ncbi:uncharacterized protein LOC110406686 isoform X3 [Numida meleagris]|uniref:uncharacterized protein LOC110406686 isoform X3 n=1 Tax=Numida meleagris TaxID=8996 RepID=UPI000B3E2C9E|nr:uncharacterized protein LOC110406686 isoform X3 [Numida meleagris]